MSALQIDTGNWPIVNIVVSGTMSDAEQRELLSTIEELMTRGQRFILVTDAMRSGVGTALQRKRFAEWMQRNRASFQTVAVRSIVVIQSDLVRGAIRAITWLSKTDLDAEYVPDLEAAHARAQALLPECTPCTPWNPRATG